MVPGTSRTRMKILVPARTYPERQPHWDAARSIIARMDTLRHQEIREKVKARLADMRMDFEAQVEAEAKRLNGNARADEELLALVERYERVLGGRLEVQGQVRGFGSNYTDKELGLFARWLEANRIVSRAGEFLEGTPNPGAQGHLLRRVAQALESFTPVGSRIG